METTSTFSIEHFLFGLGVGLVITIVVYIFQVIKQSSLEKKIKELKNHLHLKMDIDAEASQGRKQEFDQLKKENENLRVTNQVLSQKPGRREVLNFHIYQKAINIMSESLVGFAPAWQKALRESEQEMEDIQAGKSPFLKKFLPNNLFGISGKTIDVDDPNGKKDD